MHKGDFKREEGTQRSDQSRKLLCLLDKESIHLQRIDKAKGFGLEVVNGGEITRKLRA